MKKLILGLVAIVILAGVYLFVGKSGGVQPKLLPLPTKEHPTSTGLYSNVPPFDQWMWKEGKDKEGDVIYKIKVPMVDKYVGGVEQNDIRLNTVLTTQNILKEPTPLSVKKYFDSHEESFNGKYSSTDPSGETGRYRSVNSDTRAGSVQRTSLFLTNKFLVSLIYEDDPDCAIVPTGNEKYQELLKQCTEYNQIYLPIVEKALSTLEIPDYVDDRGFASSTEIKLLPDSLRAYEVR